ncbi:MAG: transporter [Lachnospiraceae bacterium]|nr:transporter [Lachnospiraceae bacterium]
MALSVSMRSRLVKGAMLLFLCCLPVFPSVVLSGAKNGLLLWFNQVLPSLLPFLILSTLFLSTGLSDSIANRLAPVLSPVFRCSPAGCYAVIIGLFAGLPIGAKTVSALVDSGKITKKEGCYLLPLCNNPSPLFLLGFISVSVLERPDLCYVIFFIVTLSSVLAAMLLHRDFLRHAPDRSFCSDSVAPVKSRFTFSFLQLDAAIEQAFSVLTRVGGYIILFSVLAALLAVLPLPAPVLSCAGAFLEITSGSASLAALSLPSSVFIPLVTGFVTFGGLSAAAQTKSVLAGTALPFAHYLFTKAIAGLLAGLLMSVYVQLFG